MMEEKLRVWWIPQVPGESFCVPVADLEQAALIIETLADYDEFQFQQGVKPDYTNAGGLEYRGAHGDWWEWHSEAEGGLDIHEWMERGREPNT